jgi:mRNA-degrading endonuclease RelE of RelBE toxin-antitoxin system
MNFEIKFTEEALDDLAAFRKYDQTLILDMVDRQLTHQPAFETRNRKRLRPNRVSEWEPRIGRFRVFYDVLANDLLVKIVAVGYKEGSGLFLRGEEFEL